jgi:septal ring factor EnvC (AmiA/AmiB activator)
MHPASAAFVALTLLLPLGGPAPQAAEKMAAEKPPAEIGKRLKVVEKAIHQGKKKSQALEKQANALRRKLTGVNRNKVALAQDIQGLEAEMTDLEREISELNDAEAEKKKLLVSRRRQFAQLLAALQRLSRLPPEAVFAYPDRPANLVRAAILLRTTLPRIEGQAARLREDLIALDATRGQIAEQRAKLAAAAARIDDYRHDLEKAFQATKAARRDTLAARQVEATRLKRLTEEAGSLRDLFNRLQNERRKREALRKKTFEKQKLKEDRRSRPMSLDPHSQVTAIAPFEIRPISKARGRLNFPAVGRIKGRYGGAVRKGIRRKGIVVATRANAAVVAPFDGKVVFAGTFRGYGLLLIIEHSEGYHSLLSGLASIDAIIGQALLSGEPVGKMGNSGAGREQLYVELRRNGTPIDPMPWLTARKGKGIR